jgi:dTDP-4-amino-4,6-dideoxygalactose transaminase
MTAIRATVASVSNSALGATDKIPLVDLTAQYATIQPVVDAAIQRVIATTSFILGPDVAAFEEEFAEFCGASRCVGVSSGTAALELVLRAFGVGPGDEVITVAHTFIATAEAISAVGATPVFVDILPDTYNMDPAALAAAVTPATRAVIPVHIYGQPADMTAIMAVAREHGLMVIEDAAQAHGASWEGETTGSLADAACFSFYPGKNLGAYGDAGAVVTNHAALAEQIALLRNHGRRDKYFHEQIGFGHRIDTLQAAVLRAKLPYLAEWTERRRDLAARYDTLLADLGVTRPAVDGRADSAWHLYVIRTPERDALLEHLQSRGIGAGVHYPLPLHEQPAYAHLGYVGLDLPVTATIAATCLSLPLYPEMTHAQQDRVVAAVAEFFDSEGVG